MNLIDAVNTIKHCILSNDRKIFSDELSELCYSFTNTEIKDKEEFLDFCEDFKSFENENAGLLIGDEPETVNEICSCIDDCIRDMN